MKRNKLILLFFVIVVGALLCACNQNERKQGNEIPTIDKIEPESVTVTLNPIDKVEIRNGTIKIDESHFTSPVFRQRIAENYDTNKDGYLSVEERNAVTYIGIDYDEREFADECLDGFEYFSNLEEVHISQGKEVILKNLMSLKRVSGEEGYVGTLRIENCPNVESLFFYNILVEDLRVSGESAAKLEFAEYSGAGQMELDGSVTLSFEDKDKYPGKYIYTDMNGARNVDTYDLKGEAFNRHTEWTNTVENVAPLSAKEIEDALLGCVPEHFEFAVSKLTGEEDDGGSGYRVGMKRKGARSEKAVYELYGESLPKAEDFFVRPMEIQEVTVYTYSPNRGTKVMVTWKIEAVYRGAQEETVLGHLEEIRYAYLLPDGAVEID